MVPDRARPVAVLVSAAEFSRLAGPRVSFAEVIDAYRAAIDPKSLRGEDAFADLRDRDPGRDVAL